MLNIINKGVILINHYPFKLTPLPYTYDALEPYIDQKTVEIHHDKHLKTYIDNLNEILALFPAFQSWSLERILNSLHAFPIAIREKVKNNAGGIYAHNFYFKGLTPLRPPITSNLFAQSFTQSYGSYDEFRKKFTEAAKDLFGSGWVWLVSDKYGFLRILPVFGHDVSFLFRFKPLLVIDVWEHAYYLKYQNRRIEYINNWFNLINWKETEKNFHLP